MVVDLIAIADLYKIECKSERVSRKLNPDMSVGRIVSYSRRDNLQSYVYGWSDLENDLNYAGATGYFYIWTSHG